MKNNKKPTSYHDINIVLDAFYHHIEKILASNFIGMYLYGSLAMGDFNIHTSDIDFIVITNAEVTENEFDLLYKLHEKFASSDLTWANKVEVAYIAKKELGNYQNFSSFYPQIEKGGKLIKEKLEMGWAFQCYTLHEFGITIQGPEPKLLFEAVNEKEILRAAKSIANLWKEQAHDEKELNWLIQREEQAFVILTLCRFLYFISERKIASKPLSAQWAFSNLSKKWQGLIEDAIKKNDQPAIVSEKDVKDTIEFIDYTALMLNKA